MSTIKTLEVKVTPNARENILEELAENTYSAKVTATPESGKANEALIKLLSKTLHMAKSRFTIIRGATDRHKVIGILSE